MCSDVSEKSQVCCMMLKSCRNALLVDLYSMTGSSGRSSSIATLFAAVTHSCLFVSFINFIALWNIG